MASSEREDIIGIIIIPITIPAERALKPERFGIKVFRKGVTVKRAKYPYTTVGTPARISTRGFMILRVFSLEYSLRYIAIKRPEGIEMDIAMRDVKKVPATRGQIPKRFS
jgi:hypothetical protein